MKFKRGQLVIINKKGYLIGELTQRAIFGVCLVMRTPAKDGPYCLWSTKKQDKVYIYEQYLTPINSQETQSEA